jgi:ankyrin repeat protein
MHACVRHGADVNARNGRGNTALHYATQYGFTALADFLKE